MSLEALELDGRGADISKPELALVERKTELAKRDSMVAAMMEKVKEGGVSASEKLEKLKLVLAARASLLEVTRLELRIIILLRISKKRCARALDKLLRSIVGEAIKKWLYVLLPGFSA